MSSTLAQAPVWASCAHLRLRSSMVLPPSAARCRAHILGPDQSHAHAAMVRMLEGPLEKKKWVRGAWGQRHVGQRHVGQGVRARGMRRAHGHGGGACAVCMCVCVSPLGPAGCLAQLAGH